MTLSELAQELSIPLTDASELLWSLGVMASRPDEPLDDAVVSAAKAAFVPPAPVAASPAAPQPPQPAKARGPKLGRIVRAEAPESASTAVEATSAEPAPAPPEETPLVLTGDLADRVFEWAADRGLSVKVVLDALARMGHKADHLSRFDIAIMERAAERIAGGETARIEENLRSGLKKRRRFKT